MPCPLVSGRTGSPRILSFSSGRLTVNKYQQSSSSMRRMKEKNRVGAVGCAEAEVMQVGRECDF